jgi:hypothetical protein
MKLLQFLITAAAFLLCLLLGAAGGLLAEIYLAPTWRTPDGGRESLHVSLLGVPAGPLLGSLLGLLLGAAAALQIWRLLDR